jgi:hypothetical protein
MRERTRERKRESERERERETITSIVKLFHRKEGLITCQ